MASQLYRRCNGGEEQPAEQYVLAGFLEIIAAFEDLYVVIDAVDESPRDRHREGLLNVINELCKCKNVHVLAASRKEIDIAIHFSRVNAIEIEVAGSGMNSDIEDYILGQFMNDSKLKKFPTQLKSEAQDVLSKKANGMCVPTCKCLYYPPLTMHRFRWVFCQLQELKRCRTKQKFMDALHSLPETLAETYQRIVESVDEDSREPMLRSLAWIAFARRPLTIAEVAEAAVLNPEQDELLDTDNRFLEPVTDILEILGSLVVVEDHETSDGEISDENSDCESEYLESSKAIKLAHFTVKEYLITQLGTMDVRGIREMSEGADFFLTKSCLRYIIFAFHGLDKTLLFYTDRFPLFHYAINFWSQHATALSNDKNRQLEWFKLYILKDPDLLEKWRHAHSVEARVLSRGYLSGDSTQLHYAAHFDCLQLVQELVDKGDDITARNERLLTPVHLAARKGYNAIVQVFMEKIGAKLEGHASGQSPLICAWMEDHVDTVKTILQYLPPTIWYTNESMNPLRKLLSSTSHFPPQSSPRPKTHMLSSPGSNLWS